MSQSINIRDLPAEILHIIAQDLDVSSLIRLRSSCRDLRESIPSPTHRELLKVERTKFGTQNDLYACRDCLRLRPRAKFADKMVEKRKGKGGSYRGNRWCLDCGINPRPGTNRYNPGNLIMIQGEPYAICLKCRTFRHGALIDGRCNVCQPFTTVGLPDLFDKTKRRRDRLRVEQAELRAERPEPWGFEYYDSGEKTASITLSEHNLAWSRTMDLESWIEITPLDQSHGTMLNGGRD
ncbi:hypothetical protein EMPG_13029 [Blastomyces silverae]|uniref:F-box domain-containing protein n=1 Tax=Blastomyces silverae TaxID=2060906 RepID=A0A0H1BLE6_9EURO|nr:hypothetical protein EMPG_13029 [Blastomyces silverae]